MHMKAASDSHSALPRGSPAIAVSNMFAPISDDYVNPFRVGMVSAPCVGKASASSNLSNRACLGSSGAKCVSFASTPTIETFDVMLDYGCRQQSGPYVEKKITYPGHPEPSFWKCTSEKKRWSQNWSAKVMSKQVANDIEFQLKHVRSDGSLGEQRSHNSQDHKLRLYYKIKKALKLASELGIPNTTEHC